MSIDILNLHSPEWMDRGNCAGRPAEDTPEGRREYGRRVDERWSPDGSTREEAATRNCAGCPVATDCLTYALADPELLGIWGGTTTQERNRIRTGNPDCGTMTGYRRHHAAGETACRHCSMANAQASRMKRAAATEAGAA